MGGDMRARSAAAGGHESRARGTWWDSAAVDAGLEGMGAAAPRSLVSHVR
jgi:hypothetical protein